MEGRLYDRIMFGVHIYVHLVSYSTKVLALRYMLDQIFIIRPRVIAYGNYATLFSWNFPKPHIV